MMPRLVILVPALASILALACGDSGGTTTTGGGGSDGDGGGTVTSTSTGGSGTGGAPIECEAPDGEKGAVSDVEVDSVTAIARDESGDFLEDVPLQLCGYDLCLNATTNGLGQALFTNSVDTLDRPVFKPGDSLTVGKIGYPYTADAPTPFTGVFPRMEDSGDTFAAGESITVAGATVELPAGGVAVVNTLIYDEPAKETFRAGVLAEEDVTAAAPDDTFSMIYALGPVDTLFCPAAKLTVDNYANLPADTEVEFWGQELEISEDFAGYGEWFKLSDGVVSADGATVSTAAGGGLPVLMTVAIKAK